MRRLRRYARVARVLGVVSLGLGMAGMFGLLERLGLNSTMDRRQRWSQFFMTRLSNALPFRVTVHGELPQTPMLWVSNHVSWTDIPLLGMVAPMSFLSKAEVRTWPVAGWLAAKAGSLFIRRGSGDSQLIRKQMTRHLEQAHPLLMFPEGTTTDGSHVLGFHAALLQPAIEAGAPIQPLALCYRLPDGRFTRAPAYDGDVSLLDCLKAIVAEREIVARIHVAPALSTTEQPDRKQLSQRARDTIVERIANC